MRQFVDKEKTDWRKVRQKTKYCRHLLYQARQMSHIINVIEIDSRYTIRDITKTVGIFLSRLHFILKLILKVRKTSAIWVLHILTDDQKWVRVPNAIVLITNVSLIQTN